MPYVTINGRQQFIPDAGVPGDELTRLVNPQKKPDRRTTIIKGANAEAVDSYKRYKASDLVDKQGRPVKWGDMPDRTKGGWFNDLILSMFSDSRTQQRRVHTAVQERVETTPVVEKKNENQLFWGNRSALSKRIIIEQCEDIAKQRFGNDVKIDYENANTFVVNNYLLPTKWHSTRGVVNNRTPLAIVFPRNILR